MLKLIDRYLISSFLLPLAYCLLAFNILFVAYDMSDQLKDFIDNKVPARLIVNYYVYYVPIVTSMTMPFATLLAMLYCLGNMSRNNEIIAMRASGIPLFRIIRPYLLLGGVMYACTLGMTESFVPQSRRLAAEIMPKPAAHTMAFGPRSATNLVTYSNTKAERQWTLEEMNLESNVFRGITIMQKRRGSGRQRLEAERAEYFQGYGWTFYNVKIIKYVSDNQALPVQQRRKYSQSSYTETPFDIASTQRTDPEMMTFTEMGRVMRSVSRNSENYRKLRMERQKRIAMPATCIVFVLLAAPFGIFHSRAGMVKGVITSIGLCVVYYIIVAFLISYGAQNKMPTLLAAWLPNIAGTCAGVYLLRRMR